MIILFLLEDGKTTPETNRTHLLCKYPKPNNFTSVIPANLQVKWVKSTKKREPDWYLLFNFYDISIISRRERKLRKKKISSKAHCTSMWRLELEAGILLCSECVLTLLYSTKELRFLLLFVSSYLFPMCFVEHEIWALCCSLYVPIVLWLCSFIIINIIWLN